MIQPKRAKKKKNTSSITQDFRKKKFTGQISGFMAAISKFPQLLLIISPKCGSQSDILWDNAQFKILNPRFMSIFTAIFKHMDLFNFNNVVITT